MKELKPAHYPNLFRAIEIALLGNYSISVYFDNALYHNGLADYEFIKNSLPGYFDNWSDNGYMKVEINKPQINLNSSENFDAIINRVNQASKNIIKNENLCSAGNALLKNAIERLNLGLTDEIKIKHIAKTIAKLDNSNLIEPCHLAEAINYRYYGNDDIANAERELKYKDFKCFGIKNNPIIYVNESKLNIDIINQIRNYLNAKEKQLKTK